MTGQRGFADKGYELLDDDSKKIFAGLSASAPGGPSDSVHEKRFLCNAYRFGENGAIFPTIPRVNHACTPNLSYVTDLQATKGAFYALRTLQPGDELTSSYVERVQPRAYRRRKLKETCTCGLAPSLNAQTARPDLFECHCDTCDLPLKEQQKSDLRRQMAHDLDALLPKERRFTRLMLAVHLRLRLLLEEGLDGPDVARTCNDALQLCARAGKLRRAASFARLAVHQYRLSGNLEAVRELEPFMRRPQDHPQYSHAEGAESPVEDLLRDADTTALDLKQELATIFEAHDFDKDEVDAFERGVREEAQAVLKAAVVKPAPKAKSKTVRR
jgi:hypothetical protein